MRFAERPGTDPTKRPIREIVGVDPRLNQRWSTRRAHIEARRGELAIQFQTIMVDRRPRPKHLAQQATLETRDAKHEPRSLAEQRATWLGEAAAVLGSSEAVASMVRTALAPPAETATIVDARWVSQTASRVLAVMEESRSTWQMWHVRAEAQRQVRTTDMAAERAAALVDLLVDEVLDRRSVALAAPDNILEPEPLRRVDGSSVYTVAGADLYTSQRILDAERRLVAASGRGDGPVVDKSAVDLALLEMAANTTALDAGQASLVRQMCTSGARLQLAIAPAGTGKTTAMRALVLAWTQDGGQVLGLAPSAAAVAVLGEQTGIRADTLAKLTWSLQHGKLPDWAAAVGPSTLVIIDEAGMADTLTLDTAVQFAINRGASVRLVGDDQQLAAIGAGGSSATSNTPTARCISPSYTASPTPPKQKPRSPSAKANQRRSTSTSITIVFMSATWPPPPRMPSPLGFLTELPDWTRSCLLRPASLSPNSTVAPGRIVLITARRRLRCVWPMAIRPVSEM
jgi:AAA domain/TrwC relaxase